MTDDDVLGRPAAELTDEELEQQGTQAHATRNWVFLHGSAEQFARSTNFEIFFRDDKPVRRFRHDAEALLSHRGLFVTR